MHARLWNTYELGLPVYGKNTRAVGVELLSAAVGRIHGNQWFGLGITGSTDKICAAEGEWPSFVATPVLKHC